MSNEVNNANPEKWVNLKDVAEHLSVSHDTIRAWMHGFYICSRNWT